MHATRHQRSLKQASGHPLNKRAAELLQKAGQAPSPLVIQPLLQMVTWAAENPQTFKLQSPTKVTLPQVAERAQELARAEDQLGVLKRLAENQLPETDDPQEMAGNLVLALADELTAAQSEPNDLT